MNGTVFRRPDTGRWGYKFDLGPDPLTGKRRTRSRSGFLTKKEAASELRKAIAAHERGRLVGGRRRTVQDFLEEWHQAIKPSLRRTTWVNYRNYLDAYVIPIIGGTAIQDLTPVRLNLLYAHLLEKGRIKTPGGLAPKTVQNVHRMLHRALRDAVKWDMIPRNVAEDASPPRAPRRRPQVWTPEQLGAFVQHARPDRFYALWLLVATTGLRRGELAGLTRSDIDLVGRKVSTGTPRVVADGRVIESEAKTRSGERNLALDPTTVEALREYLSTWQEEAALLGQDRQLLFVWPNGNPLHPDTITALFHRLCVEASLPKIRLHDVRHSYATAALKAGIAPKVISERLGHATAAFTLQTYTHVIPGMDQAAADLVAALILGGSQTSSSAEDGSDVPGNVPGAEETVPEMQSAAAIAAADVRSGGRI